MSTITVKTDGHCSNYDALEAVGRWMLDGYHQRVHKPEREITATSGRKLKVKELAQKKGMAICSCSFKVTNLTP